MAYPNTILISALRDTASRLRDGAFYSWGHHGACNCGNLLQVITTLTKEEIVTHAHTGTGEWTEMAEDICAVTGAPAFYLVSQLEKIGLTPTDIHYIEYLEDREVLNNLEGGFRWLKRNVREDVIAYFEAFANLLEDSLLAKIDIGRLIRGDDARAITKQRPLAELQHASHGA